VSSLPLLLPPPTPPPHHTPRVGEPWVDASLCPPPLSPQWGPFSAFLLLVHHQWYPLCPVCVEVDRARARVGELHKRDEDGGGGGNTTIEPGRTRMSDLHIHGSPGSPGVRGLGVQEAIVLGGGGGGLDIPAQLAHPSPLAYEQYDVQHCSHPHKHELPCSLCGDSFGKEVAVPSEW
jgi:hypothetical protein